MHKYKILKKHKYNLENYYLNHIKEDDIEKIRIWRNEQINILRQDKYITHDEQIKYYSSNVWNEYENDCPDKILMAFNKDNHLIGYGGLVHIDWNSKIGEMSFLLKTSIAKNENKYNVKMTKFISILQSIAFEELKMNSISTETYSSRKSHILILEKNNFKLNKKIGESFYHSLDMNT